MPTTESVLNPEAPLALRLSGQLLLGIVRVYIRKLQFLETDAQEAVSGLQELDAHGPSAEVRDGGRAPELAITLPALDPLDLFDPQSLFAPGGGQYDGPTRSGGSSRRTSSAGSASLVMAEDVSEVWGSQGGAGGWFDPDATFGEAAPGDDMDRRFSIELERLRSQAAEAPRAAAADALYMDHGPDERGGYLYGGDETMDAPPPGMFDSATPLKTPGSVPALPSTGPGSVPLPGTSGARFDLGRLSEVLPSAGPPSTAASPGRGAQGTPPRSLDRRAPRSRPAHSQARLRRKKATLDVDGEGRPCTELPGKAMRALMADRTSLLRARGGSGAQGASSQAEADLGTLAPWEQGTQGGGWPPALHALFSRALSTQAPRHPLRPGGDEDGEEAAVGELPRGRVGATPETGEHAAALEDGALPWEEATGQQGYELDPWAVEEEATSGRSSGSGAQGDGFTALTQEVLDTLGARFAAPGAGAKRRRGAAPDAPLAAELGFDALLGGSGRREAARWFFELLVLQNRGHVVLAQDQPFGPIAIRQGAAPA